MAVSVDSIVKNMNLGVSKQTLSAEPNSPLHTLLIGVHQEIIDRLGESITKHGIIASNRLKQSMVTVDSTESGKIDVALSMEFYWKYVNFGVNGTRVNRGAPTWGSAPGGTLPFKDAILGWIRDKGLQARPGQTYEQMAYAIMKSVREKGIKARPFYTDVVNAELKRFLSKSISEVYGEAINVEISDPWQ